MRIIKVLRKLQTMFQRFPPSEIDGNAVFIESSKTSVSKQRTTKSNNVTVKTLKKLNIFLTKSGKKTESSRNQRRQPARRHTITVLDSAIQKNEGLKST
jgi:hypothetical protein